VQARKRKPILGQSLEAGKTLACKFENEPKWGDTYLWHQALEKTGESFILDHAANNPESTLWVLKIPVLDTGLDNIKRSRYQQGSRCTSNRCNEVLEP
jgi:hypothetical protein